MQHVNSFIKAEVSTSPLFIQRSTTRRTAYRFLIQWPSLL